MRAEETAVACYSCRETIELVVASSYVISSVQAKSRIV